MIIKRKVVSEVIKTSPDNIKKMFEEGDRINVVLNEPQKTITITTKQYKIEEIKIYLQEKFKDFIDFYQRKIKKHRKLIAFFIIGIFLILNIGFILRLLIFIFIIFSIIVLLQPAILWNIIRSIKARKITNKEVLLEIDGDRNLGIFAYFNQQKDQVLVVFPQLTQDGELEYIRSWHDLRNISVHALENIKNRSQNFDMMKQLITPIREHLQIEQDISKLEQQEEKIEQLIKLVSSSDFYSSQKELYERALSQVQQMIEKASKLEQVYVRLIRELLIGKELSDYDPNQIINNHMAIDSQYQKIKEEYQQLKDTATAYTELLQNEKL